MSNTQPLSGNAFTPLQRVSLNSSLTNLILDSDAGNSSLVVRIGANPSFYIDKFSNVGINTASPSAQLEVASAIGECLRLRYGTSTSAFANLFVTSTGDLAINAATTGSSITMSSSLNITNHDGATTGLRLGGTVVAATAQQLGFAAVTTAGVAEASRALVLNSTRDISNIHNLTAAQLTGQLQTAAQPKVTSLGTLTSLSVSGDLSVNGNLTLSGGGSVASALAYLTAITSGVAAAEKALIVNSDRDINNIRNIGASTLSLGSNTLSATEASYLSGVVAGTAAVSKALVLNSSGDVSGIRNLSAVQFSGQLQTAAQPNITSLGTLTSLSLGSQTLTQTEGQYLTNITAGTTTNGKALVVNASGDISGIRNLSASQLSGQLQTAPQPNVTSIGTLTSLTVSGQTTLTSTKEATNATNGALTVSGGLAVAKSTFVGNDLTVGGNLYVNGTSSVVNSTSVSIQDNTLILNASPVGVNDSGLLISRFQTANDTATGSVIADTPNWTTTVASATSTTVILTNGDATDNYYQGWWLKVGTQARKVQSYVGSSKTITVESAFATVPNAAATIGLYNRAFASFIWNETSKRFSAAYTAKDSSSSLTILDDAGLRALDIQSTGQLTATSSVDSTSTTTGALVVTGGVGIGKNLYVNSGIYGAIQTPSQPAITSVNTLDITGHNGSVGLKLGGALVTATAAQLNYLSGATLGATTASKAVVADSTNAVQLSTLRIGSGLGDTDLSYLTNTATDAVFRIGRDLTNNNSMRILWNATGQYLGFATSGAASSQLVITSSGNIGVGTVSPGCRLSFGATVADRVLAITESGVDFYGFGSVSTTSALSYQAKAQHEFYTGSSSISMGTLSATITSKGLVATELTGQLQTASQPKITSIGTLASLTVGTTTVDGPTLGYLVGANEGTVSGSKVIIASSTKDVSGIRKLALSGAPDLLKLTNTDATSYVERALVSDTHSLKTGIYGTASTTNASLAYWNYNGADRMLMTTSGDLMVGTTTGGYRVNVGGTINATGYYVNGVLLDAASVTYTSGVTPGTAAPNKAMVLDASSNITNINSLTTSSITVGSTTASGTQIAYLTGVSPGTAANNKALVLSSSGSINGVNALACTSLTISGVDISSSITSSAVVTNITPGSATANKALVLDSNLNVSGVGSISMTTLVLGGTSLTTTEAAYLNGVTAGTVTNGKALVASSTGTVAGLTSLALGNQTLTSTEAGYLTGVTAGTAAPSKAIVLDSKASITISALPGDLISGRILRTGDGYYLSHKSTSLNTEMYSMVDDTNGVQFGAYTASDFKLMTSKTTRMRITSTGNVGINLASPAYRLDVNGTLNATSYYTSGTLVDLTLLTGTTAGTATSSKALIVGSTGTVAGLNSLGTTTIVVNGSSISSEAAYLAGATVGAVTASKVVVANGTKEISGLAKIGTTVLTLGGSDLGATEAGYLTGITAGTAAAGKAVVANASADVSGIRVLSLAGTVGNLLNLTNTTSSSFVSQSMTSDTYALTIGVRGSTNTTNPNLAYVSYNNADRILINASGEVMVGTTTSGYRLNVGGSMNATSYNLSGSALDFSNLGYIVGVTKGTAAYGKALVLDDTGKINSGVVSFAATTLILNGSTIRDEAPYIAGATLGTVAASKMIVADASSQVTGFAKLGTTVLTLGGADLTAIHAGYLNGATVGAVTASKVVIASAASEISGLSKVTTTTLTLGTTDITATQAGYLSGITVGQVAASKAVTASSGRDISNVRSISLNNDGNSLILSNTTNTARTTIQFSNDVKIFEVGTAGSTNTSFPNSSFYLYDSTAAAIRMVVDPSGNVGVGTTTPTTKLTVSGIVNATGYQLNGTAYDLSLLSATAGTATGSKALILSASKAVDVLSVTGVLTAGTIAATTYRQGSTTYDISLLSATAGTATASKALVLDANKAVDAINAGTVTSTSLTDSSSTTSGALVVSGGAAVAKKLYVGTDLYVSGTIYVNQQPLGSSQYVAGITEGTAAASKALVLDASKNISGINSLTSTTLVVSDPSKTPAQLIASGRSYEIGGYSWVGRAVVTNSWNSICWSPELGLFVAVASSGTANRVMTSKDGINWICRACPLDLTWISVCWSSDLARFVAVALNGATLTNRAMWSSDGINWAIATTPNLDNTWQSVCWSKELALFVAVASVGVVTGNRVMTSSNGTTWTQQASASDNQWQSVCWSKEQSLFVAVAQSGTNSRVMTSPNGTTWTTRTGMADNSWKSVCWAANLGLFVAVAAAGDNNRVMTSTNGTTWTARTAGSSGVLESVCWSPELSIFVAVNNGGKGVYVSSNGIKWWVESSPSSTDSWKSVCWASQLGRFVAVSPSGYVMTSYHAIDKPINITPTGCGIGTTAPQSALHVSSQSGKCLRLENGISKKVDLNVDSDGSLIVRGSLNSDDLNTTGRSSEVGGTTWTTRNPANYNQWSAVCWSADLGMFVSVSKTGSANRVMTSTNGINWVPQTSAADNPWTSVCWSSELGLLVAVSTDGTVMTSPNGTIWTSRSVTGSVASWQSVCWAPELSLFVAVAYANTTGTHRVMTSSDGVTWTTSASASDSNQWHSVCWSSQLSLFVAVAISGAKLVMTSADGTTWILRTSAVETNQWRSICWAPELSTFVAVADSGTNRAMSSYDGINWTARTSAYESSSWFSVCWSPEASTFVAVSTGSLVQSSRDGISWVLRTPASGSAWYSVCWSPQLCMFAAVSNGGSYIMTSSHTSNELARLSSSGDFIVPRRITANGGISVNSGGLNVGNNGGMNITGYGTISAGLNVSSGGLSVGNNGGMNISGYGTISGGLNVSSGGLSVSNSGGMTISGGGVISNGLNVSSGGVSVTGGMAITGYSTITGSATISGSTSVGGGMTVTGTVNVNTGDLNVSGTMLVRTGQSGIGDSNYSDVMLTLNNRALSGSTYVHALYVVSGTCSFPSAVVNRSDYRIKTNISDLQYGLNEIMNLRPLMYDIENVDRRQMGFIAHEMQEHLPELVTGHKDEMYEDGNQKLQAIQYTSLVVVLTKAMQEQQDMLDELKQKNELMQQEIVDLKALVNRLLN